MGIGLGFSRIPALLVFNRLFLFQGRGEFARRLLSSLIVNLFKRGSKIPFDMAGSGFNNWGTIPLKSGPDICSAG
ncbi:hypothetical protein CQZ93_02605 [Ochrobactrum vermis]|nr:hypothetical protein CQZ93_02605 [Ochrobactrum vermis]